MSAVDKLLEQIIASTKKEEYIDKIVQILADRTEAQVEYTYHLIRNLFCQTSD